MGTVPQIILSRTATIPANVPMQHARSYWNQKKRDLTRASCVLPKKSLQVFGHIERRFCDIIRNSSHAQCFRNNNRSSKFFRALDKVRSELLCLIWNLLRANELRVGLSPPADRVLSKRQASRTAKNAIGRSELNEDVRFTATICSTCS
jgi:hypothetical protein